LFFLRDEGIFILANACTPTCTKTKNSSQNVLSSWLSYQKAGLGNDSRFQSFLLQNFQLERTPAIAPTATAGHDEA